jgi:hypothetical protein
MDHESGGNQDDKISESRGQVEPMETWEPRKPVDPEGSVELVRPVAVGRNEGCISNILKKLLPYSRWLDSSEPGDKAGSFNEDNPGGQKFFTVDVPLDNL